MTGQRKSRRNRRAGVEDLWRDLKKPRPLFDDVGNPLLNDDGSPVTTLQPKLHGKGKRWRGRYVDERGREHTQRFDRKVDAQAWIENVVVEHAIGTYVDPKAKSALFETLAERWFETKSSKAAKTVAGYRSLLDTLVLPRWKDMPVGDIDYEDVQSWVLELQRPGGSFKNPDKGLSPSRVVAAYQVVDQVLAYAIRAKHLAHNPADEVELPRIEHPEKTYLTHDQVAALTSHCGRFEDAALTLAYCGPRFGELAALRVRDFDAARSRIRISRSATHVAKRGIVEGSTKNHAARSVPVPRFLRDRLVEAVAGRSLDEYLFPSRHGTVLSLGEFRWAFDKAVAAAGLGDLTPHELRHTAASLAIAANADVKIVQRMLGHKTATLTLDLYGHLMDDNLDTVSNAMDAGYATARESAAYPLRTEINSHLKIVR
ncbi:site-specific integrase [Rhodococcoides fascians]|uniref:tyrosine-type recombinase/integrase n=1 Tax=Rhodococcoides fascians TaxID=1828 RepID=UPI000B9B8C22|nr:site-specific integrase [Rhodococcus fascians]OZE92477.1 site-specific integrase [Rhodococcus fascians]OZF23110.1 site-specific integrase [Rhodococcus fascians]OZF24824.1 site-specific integrase [Rhodococcus fascians]OZF72419.1 site-specific integrase [Rhodococcus fascians]OZF73717.1 site-specific integrase [Rhodococcus fascians]